MGLDTEVFQHPGTRSRFDLPVRLAFPSLAMSFVLLTYEDGRSMPLGAVQPAYSSILASKAQLYLFCHSQLSQHPQQVAT